MRPDPEGGGHDPSDKKTHDPSREPAMEYGPTVFPNQHQDERIDRQEISNSIVQCTEAGKVDQQQEERHDQVKVVRSVAQPEALASQP